MSPGIVAESDLKGNLQSEYIFFDGERMARKDFSNSTPSVSYYFSNHLKTVSVITDPLGNIKEDADFYPWGGELQLVNNDSNHYKFGGHERDGETGLDYFGARHYGNWLSRFLSPDWSSAPVPVPYADLTNPQTLNQYAYAHNSPTSIGDDDGHDGQMPELNESDGDEALKKKSPSDCPALSDCSSSPGAAPPARSSPSAAQHGTAADVATGTGKELVNTGRDILGQAVPGSDKILAELGILAEQQASNPTQEKAMKITALLSLLVPVGGEEAAAGKVESKLTARIAALVADAQKRYPKLANKIQLHHIFPIYLGGAANGERKALDAAYHQFITNAFRQLAPYGQKFTGSVKELLEKVYEKFPLP